MNLEQLRARHIPFAGLRSTTEAFIDYAIEECSPKFNYALIGSGVSQNPNQPVSLRDLHGFQLGGVSLPQARSIRRTCTSLARSLFALAVTGK